MPDNKTPRNQILKNKLTKQMSLMRHLNFNTQNNWQKIIFIICLIFISKTQASANGNFSPAINAAKIAAEETPACQKIKPFYFEIGDSQGSLAFKSVGYSAPKSETQMPIASATKWIFGAYVVQRQGGHLTDAAIQALTMKSGYTDLKHGNCLKLLPSRREQQTVYDCLNTGKNAELIPEHFGKFFYNGGHFQKFAAIDLQLGNKNNEQLAKEIKSQLKIDFNFTFGSPIPASGITTSASEYAKFLRALLQQKILLGKMLGDYAVCTAPKTCANAISTPIPANYEWLYSLAHWVEADPKTGDGSFSSPGAFGFYPWIDAHKHYYGIIARKEYSEQAAVKSVECGMEIRRAFFANLSEELR